MWNVDGKTSGPALQWPGGSRVAVLLTFDFDAEFLRSSRAALKGKKIGFTDFSRGQYGPHEGLWRCLDMLDRFGLKATFFVPGAVIEEYRECVEEIHRRGHEIACHGYRHESAMKRTREEEIAALDKAEALIQSVTGRKPVGHRAPESILQESTPELLQERGYLYSSSMKDCDWPYLWEIGGKETSLVELPNDVMMDDFTYYYFTYSDPAVRAMYRTREVMDAWRAEFDGLREEGNKLFVLKLHPQMIGRLSRIRALSELIGYMKRCGAWFATCEEAARYVLEQKKAGGDEKAGAAEKAESVEKTESLAIPVQGECPRPAQTAAASGNLMVNTTAPGNLMINRGRACDIPRWPDGKRIAVMLAFDIDAETMWTTHGDGSFLHMTDLSRGLYGPKQGIPRILAMLDRWGVKGTFFIPGVVAERYPEMVREIARRGHEIGFHGYYHEEFPTTTKEEEDATMRRAEGVIEAACGQKLRGHRGPGGVIHDYSLELFLEHGYIYSTNWRDCDGPFLHEINGKTVPLVELPKDSIFDDTAYDFYTDTPPERYELKAPAEMMEIWKEEFDALAEEGRMINFVLHPQFMGRASRINMLSDLIGYMLSRGAWFETNEHVAEYVLKQCYKG